MEFYQQCASLTPAQIARVLDARTTLTRTRERQFANRGQYLPLQVWANAGWDPDLIKASARPEDVKIHHTGHTVYRVCVDEEVDVNSTKREQALMV